jgi:hypothetical protein
MQAERYCSHAQEAKQGLPPPRPVWCSRQRRAVPRRAVGMLRWQTRTQSIRVALLHDCALRCTVQQLQSACAGASYVACSVACCTLLQPWQTPLRSVRCPQPACSRPRCHPTAVLPMLPVAPATAPPHVFQPRHRQRHKSVQPESCTPSTRELRHRIAMLLRCRRCAAAHASRALIPEPRDRRPKSVHSARRARRHADRPPRRWACAVHSAARTQSETRCSAVAQHQRSKLRYAVWNATACGNARCSAACSECDCAALLGWMGALASVRRIIARSGAVGSAT